MTASSSESAASSGGQRNVWRRDRTDRPIKMPEAIIGTKRGDLCAPSQHLCDVTDARLLGRHALWSATEPKARNEAFNTVNGDVFRWRDLWKVVADGLVSKPPSTPEHRTLSMLEWVTLTRCGGQLVAKHDLAPHKASELASWWHTDADLGREVETFADMSKSRTMGFLDYQPTYDSFTDLFNELRSARIIPNR